MDGLGLRHTLNAAVLKRQFNTAAGVKVKVSPCEEELNINHQRKDQVPPITAGRDG